MEDFNLNQRVREGRKKNASFANSAEKITKIPEKKVEEKNPIEELKKNVVEEAKEEKKETITLDKGFSVGVTKDGTMRLVPFGNPNRLELIGFSEFVKTKMDDMLGQIAVTSTTQSMKVINDNLNAIAKGINSLIEKNKG